MSFVQVAEHQKDNVNKAIAEIKAVCEKYDVSQVVVEVKVNGQLQSMAIEVIPKPSRVAVVK